MLDKSAQYTNTDDEKLFSFIEKGDKGAFTQAYDRYHKLLYVLAYRYLMNADMAEDVVQHVFARLWEFRSELHVGISLKNYLFTMTKNHVLNLIRNENSAISKNYEIAQSAPVYEDNLIENLEKKELELLYQSQNGVKSTGGAMFTIIVLIAQKILKFVIYMPLRHYIFVNMQCAQKNFYKDCIPKFHGEATGI